MPKPIFKKGVIHVGLIVLVLVGLTALVTITSSAAQNQTRRGLEAIRDAVCNASPNSHQCKRLQKESDAFLTPPDPSKLYLASRDDRSGLCCKVKAEQYWVDYSKIYTINNRWCYRSCNCWNIRNLFFYQGNQGRKNFSWLTRTCWCSYNWHRTL